jgi:hypothetical protein
LEPLVGAILVVQLHPGQKATAPSPWRQLDLTQERIENQKGDEELRIGHGTRVINANDISFAISVVEGPG